MAMANMNLIGVFVTKLWPVQALACGGTTKNIISPKFSNFGDIITRIILDLFQPIKIKILDILLRQFSNKLYKYAVVLLFHISFVNNYCHH